MYFNLNDLDLYSLNSVLNYWFERLVNAPFRTQRTSQRTLQLSYSGSWL